jgi:hypothetical protein
MDLDWGQLKYLDTFEVFGPAGPYVDLEGTWWHLGAYSHHGTTLYSGNTESLVLHYWEANKCRISATGFPLFCSLALEIRWCSPFLDTPTSGHEACPDNKSIKPGFSQHRGRSKCDGKEALPALDCDLLLLAMKCHQLLFHCKKTAAD